MAGSRPPATRTPTRRGCASTPAPTAHECATRGSCDPSTAPTAPPGARDAPTRSGTISSEGVPATDPVLTTGTSGAMVRPGRGRSAPYLGDSPDRGRRPCRGHRAEPVPAPPAVHSVRVGLRPEHVAVVRLDRLA